jgi:DNA replication initiation complex subunit (GINS family)
MSDQESQEKEVIITYDTLFEILRNEKTKEDLQKLSETFFQDVVSYLNEKQSTLSNDSNQQNLFEEDEKEKTVHQVSNIKKIIKEIYERREKKIINMALNKSRFISNMIDTSALLDQEKFFYELLVSLLNNKRDSILKKLINGKIPEKLNIELSNDQKEELFQKADELSKEVQDTTKEDTTTNNSETKLIRFLTEVPQFMGEDMREYGPYEEEDVSKLPSNIAQLLIEKERAEEIKEN